MINSLFHSKKEIYISEENNVKFLEIPIITSEIYSKIKIIFFYQSNSSFYLNAEIYSFNNELKKSALFPFDSSGGVFKKSEEVSLDISFLESGVYLLSFKTQSNNYPIKFKFIYVFEE